MSACTDFRRAMLSDPHTVDPALRAHAQGCADCSAFAGRAADFETRLRGALALELGGGAPAVSAFRGAGRRPRGAGASGFGKRGWLALAASLTVAIGAVTGLWLAAPGPSLAADVVTHMAEEPQAWGSRGAVPTAALEAVLRDSRLQLTGTAGVVSYANRCVFRGRRVPHLVVQTDAGPVTVMVLAQEETARGTVTFDESGYRGVILPVAGHGSIAVLARDRDGASDMAVLQRIAARVLSAIAWG